MQVPSIANIAGFGGQAFPAATPPSNKAHSGYEVAAGHVTVRRSSHPRRLHPLGCLPPECRPLECRPLGCRPPGCRQPGCRLLRRRSHCCCLSLRRRRSSNLPPIRPRVRDGWLCARNYCSADSPYACVLSELDISQLGIGCTLPGNASTPPAAGHREPSPCPNAAKWYCSYIDLVNESFGPPGLDRDAGKAPSLSNAPHGQH